jgi:hypothetical protein
MKTEKVFKQLKKSLQGKDFKYITPNQLIKAIEELYVLKLDETQKKDFKFCFLRSCEAPVVYSTDIDSKKIIKSIKAAVYSSNFYISLSVTFLTSAFVKAILVYVYKEFSSADRDAFVKKIQTQLY